MRSLFVCALVLGAPAAWARSAGPPIMRTGAPIDGGLDCTACHRNFAPANQDPRGRVAIEVVNYQPGVKQTLRIRVEHPDSNRWGYQLTARYASDLRRQAGTFTVNANTRVMCAPNSNDAPCNGQLEFASQTAASTYSGTAGKGLFDVEWTPPAEDAGDIIFYAAGNATDGNLNNQNDVVYTTNALIRNAGGCAVSGSPTATAFANAASGRTGLAFNTLFSIYGTNLLPVGRKRDVQAFDIVNNRFPTQIDCISVTVDGQAVPVTYVSDLQINAQAPARVADPGRVEVVLNPRTGNERRIVLGMFRTLETQPGFFTFNGTSVAARHPDGTPVANPAVVPGGRPARQGDVISLYLTGLGITNPVYQSGEIVSAPTPLTSTLTIELAGRALAASDIPYAGLAPQAISGLYQVNIWIPAGTASGNVPITIRSQGTLDSGVTQAGTTIPVAP